MSQDILSRPEPTPCKTSKLVLRYQVGTRARIGTKLHTNVKARRIVARCKRLGIDAYIAGSIRVRVSA